MSPQAHSPTRHVNFKHIQAKARDLDHEAAVHGRDDDANRDVAQHSPLFDTCVSELSTCKPERGGYVRLSTSIGPEHRSIHRPKPECLAHRGTSDRWAPL